MPKTFYSKVAGVSHKNEDGRSRQSIIKRLEGFETLAFKPEPNNRFDPNAVAIWVDLIDDPWGDYEYQIGYLNSELAAEFTERTKTGHRFEGSITEVTGGEEDQPTRGVNIEITLFEPGETKPPAPSIPSIPPAISTQQHQPVIYKNKKKEKRISQSVVYKSAKSYWVTLLLCISLGIFGIHCFYVGRIGRGILFAFTGGLFIIGWLGDIFKILSGTFKDGAGMPIRAGK
jgi:restriction system protein